MNPIREHILEFFPSKEDLFKQYSVYVGLCSRKDEDPARTMVEDGFFLVYYESVEEFLYEIGEPLEYYSDQNFERYVAAHTISADRPMWHTKFRLR